MFLTGMYAAFRLCFCLIASFLLIDTIGSRNSIFVGATTQMLTHIYVGVYEKYSQQDLQAVSSCLRRSSHSPLLIRWRALAQPDTVVRRRAVADAPLAVRLWFHSSVAFAAREDNWDAFIFFAAWCAMVLLYVGLVVPEVSGLSVEQIEQVFRGPWYDAHQRARKPQRVASIGDESPQSEDAEHAQLPQDPIGADHGVGGRKLVPKQ